MNEVRLIGNLTKDPEEPKVFASGKKRGSISIAVPRKFPDANGQKQADFFIVATWDKTAEVCYKWLRKGRQVLVCAHLQSGSYTDKATGAKKYTMDIVADDVQFLGSSTMDKGAPAGTDADPAYGGYTPVSVETDELPY